MLRMGMKGWWWLQMRFSVFFCRGLVVVQVQTIDLLLHALQSSKDHIDNRIGNVVGFKVEVGVVI